MKTIKFRPLRFEKKSGLIKVASYPQWRKVKTADYDIFRLDIDNTYKSFNPDAQVYNHKGEELFFYDYNPEDIKDVESGMAIGECDQRYGNWKTSYMYSCKGLDCDGVPVFSQNTIEAIWRNKELDKYEPLTVKTVRLWLGWFLYNLNNCLLINDK
jgi:hypothetical protein